MPERRSLGDFLSLMALSGWRRRGKDARSLDLIEACRRLLGEAGEVEGMVLALEILDQVEEMSPDDALSFFQGVVSEFAIDPDQLRAAIDAWDPADRDSARMIHSASEPPSQELIRRLNRVPGATARLVAMRGQLLTLLRGNPDLHGLDADFQHLFSSWFNRGFLEIRRIDWSTPAAILEKIIAYEAVHEITGWDDLRQRVADPDRRLFAFFHPAMPADPLIFVEVALVAEIPSAIAPILDQDRDRTNPAEANVAVFYSISNCQAGLRGISFGNFLIKQVVTELQRELKGLDCFVTLSPVPGLRRWVEQGDNAERILGAETHAMLAGLNDDQRPEPQMAREIAARYLTEARRTSGTVFDPVAHFHLGNGAVLHRIHAEADLSRRGIRNSWGVMVNYLYDGDKIETNHQAYATDRTIAASGAVRSLAIKKKKG